jgi:pyridoxine 4-dehydrogenase
VPAATFVVTAASAASASRLRVAQTVVAIAAAEQDGIAFAPWHPVTMTDGPLATRAAEVITPIARAHQASTEQVALAWQLHTSTQTLPIPGTTSIAHLKENLEAPSLRLTAAELAAIDGISAA